MPQERRTKIIIRVPNADQAVELIRAMSGPNGQPVDFEITVGLEDEWAAPRPAEPYTKRA